MRVCDAVDQGKLKVGKIYAVTYAFKVAGVNSGEGTNNMQYDLAMNRAPYIMRSEDKGRYSFIARFGERIRTTDRLTHAYRKHQKIP